MSFIAGYILGCSEGSGGGDIRIKKLDALEPLYTIDVGEGWSVRIKISADIDSIQRSRFSSSNGRLRNYTTEYSLYYCVYLNDEFKYATCHTCFWESYYESYLDSDGYDRYPDSVRQTSGFEVTSADVSFYYNSESFLNIRLQGTYIRTQTSYTFDADGNIIEDQTYESTSTGSFSSSKNDFQGSTYGGVYIVNGDVSDFKDYVYGLYMACRNRALAESS